MKQTALIILLVLVLLLAGCASEDTKADLQEALERLQFSEGAYRNDLYLQNSVNGYSVEWTSSNEDYVTDEGELTRPHPETGDVEVRLTATIAENDASAERSFTIVVEALDDTFLSLLEAKEALQEKDLFEEPVKDDLSLPASIKDASIDWRSKDPYYIDDDGTVTRPDYGEGDVLVTLIATLSVETKSLDIDVAVTVAEQDE